MRADRLLSILLLLQVHRRLTARELAGRLEVSARTIHRDMEALSTAGVPVVAERGVGGGWSLLEPYRTNLTGLKAAEVQALFLGRSPRVLADLGLAGAAEAGLIKLLAALPAVQRRDAEYVRARIHIDAAGWQRSQEAVPFLGAIQDAVWQERRLHLAYRRSDGSTVERLVDPLGLVAKGNVWYLVAAVEGEVRTYRASRVQGATLSDEPCVRPPGFDLAAYWAQSSAEFVAGLPRYPAVLRATPEAVGWARAMWRYAHIEREGPPDAEGWVRLDVRFEVEAEACQCVLGLGPQVEVLEPPELRERVLAEARGVVTLYGAAAGPGSGA